MNDFSIELSAENIVDSRTKRYFAEVYGCYTAGYYRSAVVMLWSVVVTDLLFKLDQLATAYNDTNSQEIIEEIEIRRQQNPKSPEWESTLLNNVTKKTDLLDEAEKSFLESLQKHRHLSAHPVITEINVLFSPNRETTRAHIRNVLECVLTKPPIMSRKVFNTILEDVEQISRFSLDRKGLKNFLEAKYLRYFSPATFEHVLKSMWRVTFKSADPRAEANRVINLQVLSIIFDSRKSEHTEIIKVSRDWFSDVSFEDSHLAVMIQFFNEYPQVFPLLSDALKAPIQKYANLSLDHFVSCWFISITENEHVDHIIHRIEQGQDLSPYKFKMLFESFSASDILDKVLFIGIKLYFRSSTFALADSRFREMVYPYIDSFKRDHVIGFLEGCETCVNGQATGRYRAAYDHEMILKLIETKFEDISTDQYPVFKKSLRN